MSFLLSFAQEFFYGTIPIEKLRASPRPTSVYQAILSLPDDQWAALARDVFDCEPSALDVETVLAKVVKTNTCHNLDTPVEVFIDEAGFHRILVY